MQKHRVIKFIGTRRQPDGVAAPPFIDAQFVGGAVEKQDRHLELNKPGAGAGPRAGIGRQGCGEIFALGSADSAHAIETDRTTGRRQAQNEQQARDNAVGAVDDGQIAMVVRNLAKQYYPFHSGCPPANSESGAAK